MATGDMKNNIHKLITELREIGYDHHNIDFDSLANGIPSAFLPIIHHAFLDYSHQIASYFSRKGLDLYGKTDLRFIETVYKVLMQEFSYKPLLTKDQFLNLGFAERKIIIVKDIVRLCKEKHKVLAKSKKILSAAKRSQIVSSARLEKSQLDSRAGATSGNACKDTGVERKITNLKSKMPGSQKTKVISNDVKVEKFEPKSENAKASKTKPDLKSVGKYASGNGMVNRNLPYVVPEVQAQLPKPCLTLAVTPIKESANEQCGEDLSQCLPIPSRASLIEVKEGQPQSFQIMKHSLEGESKSKLHETSLWTNSQDQPKTNDISEKASNASANDEIINIADTHDENLHKKQPNCDCDCETSKHLFEQLQAQLELLALGFKDIVTSNNDLCARVVLLETQTKLMEGRISLLEERNAQQANFVDDSIDENMHSVTNEPAISAKEEIGKHHKSSTKCQRKVEFGYNFESTDSVSYSPDKYTDDENPLPANFLPIRINGSPISDAMGEDNPTTRNIDSSNALQTREMNAKSNTPIVISDDECSIVSATNDDPKIDPQLISPIKDVSFSFMEQGTKQTVLHLQQKLEETMNLLKKSQNKP